MDKKIMLTILLNQLQIMHTMADLICANVSERGIGPQSKRYIDAAENLLKRSDKTEELMGKYL